MTLASVLDNYRPTIGLSEGEITCRGCGGDGVAYHVPRRAVQIANVDQRQRRLRGDEPSRRPLCWLIGVQDHYHRPLARVIYQWDAHGHDLLTDHPELEICPVCNGMGFLVPRRSTQ